MATIDELSFKYFVRIIKASYRIREFNEILSEIQELTYSENNQLIDREDKKKIINQILEKLKEFKEGKNILNEHVQIQKSFSNDVYLDLVSHIINQLNNQ
jgi:F0F1-type ATP synthase delta subunit